MSVPPVSGDVVELRNGQRVEGTFKGADDSAIRIEAGVLVQDRAVADEPSLPHQFGHVIS